jgi:hypothetical protein
MRPRDFREERNFLTGVRSSLELDPKRSPARIGVKPAYVIFRAGDDGLEMIRTSRSLPSRGPAISTPAGLTVRNAASGSPGVQRRRRDHQPESSGLPRRGRHPARQAPGAAGFVADGLRQIGRRRSKPC